MPPKVAAEQYIVYNDRFPPYGGRSEARQQSDWQGRINMDKLRKERHAKWVKSMKDHGASVMMLLRPESFRYATGCLTSFWYKTGNTYALVPLEGDPIVYAHGICAIQDKREAYWLPPENIRIAESLPTGESGSSVWDKSYLGALQDRVVGGLKADLEDRKLTKEVLVFDVHCPPIQEAFERVGIRTAVNPDIGVSAEEIKTPEEIECFRVVSAISDTVHWEAASFAGPGKTECEVTGYIKYRALALGGELDVAGFVLSGEHTWPNYRQSTDRMIRPGDIVYWDSFQISWNGYHSCEYRTYSAGFRASQAAQDAYKRINEWQFNALAECKPGKTTADMMKHFPPEEHMRFPRVGNAMHGLGLVNYGPPWGGRQFSLEHPYEIKEGHVFAIEPEAGIGDGQGVRLEDHVVVTKTGCEVLTRFPTDRIITIPMRDDQGQVFIPPEEHLKAACARLKIPYVAPPGGFFSG